MATDVLHYLDYRQYLQAQVVEWRSAGAMNVRQFARRAGIRAPGYLKMVSEGRRNLTRKTAEKFAKALELHDIRREYFVTLVRYNQSTDPDEKGAAFDRLMALRPRSSEFTEEKRIKRYFSQPHYVCIREMVVLKDFREEYRWIARRCIPAISPAQAREAVATLIELGLLTRNEHGNLIQSEGFVRTTDRNTQAVEAYHYHEAMLAKARQALTMLRQDERNFYALTVPMPRALFQEIVDEFYALRDRVLAKIEQAPVYDDVYQMNFQVFCVTKEGGKV